MTAKNIDEYIATFPPGVQIILQELRQTINNSAPGVEERISYGIPTFGLNGNLVHFGAYKKHIGFYPTPSGILHFKDDLLNYQVSKGTVKFSLDRPMPYDLIKRIVEFRVTETRSK